MYATYFSWPIILALGWNHYTCIGMEPLYLHWDGTFHTYQRFFIYLASVFDSALDETLLSTKDIVLGSDEEKALVRH